MDESDPKDPRAVLAEDRDWLWEQHSYATGVGLTKVDGRFAALVDLTTAEHRPSDDFVATTPGGLPIVYRVVGDVRALRDPGTGDV
jgi:hypothetical protein